MPKMVFKFYETQFKPMGRASQPTARGHLFKTQPFFKQNLCQQLLSIYFTKSLCEWAKR